MVRPISPDAPATNATASRRIIAQVYGFRISSSYEPTSASGKWGEVRAAEVIPQGLPVQGESNVFAKMSDSIVLVNGPEVDAVSAIPLVCGTVS